MNVACTIETLRPFVPVVASEMPLVFVWQRLLQSFAMDPVIVVCQVVTAAINYAVIQHVLSPSLYPEALDVVVAVHGVIARRRQLHFKNLSCSRL